jgi:hypothetical protein
VRAEHDDLRARMRDLGLDYDEVAAEFARRYRLRPRAAYRHAHGWTLTQAAGQVNTHAAQTGLDPTGRASMTASHLCEYEQWPAGSGRKPSPHVLALLAHTYNTSIRHLEARAGAGAASRHQIDAAEAALSDDHPVVPWFDFFDAGRFDAFAGYAALAAGDRPEAARRLAGALETLGPRGAKQRSVVLADLAAASMDGDRTADYLGQALDALRADWYQAGLDRVRAVRPRLGDSRHGRRLDEQVEALTAAGRR